MKWKSDVRIGGPALFKQQNSRYLLKSGLHNTDDILDRIYAEMLKIHKDSQTFKHGFAFIQYSFNPK